LKFSDSTGSKVAAGLDYFSDFWWNHRFPALVILGDLGENSAGEDIKAGDIVILQLLDKATVNEVFEQVAEIIGDS
jgi:hypothetical protein